MKNLTKLFYILGFFFLTTAYSFSAEKVDYLKTDWSFKGLFGKFDRGSLQRGYQVYTEVCAACHSMKYLSYRNLGEKEKTMEKDLKRNQVFQNNLNGL